MPTEVDIDKLIEGLDLSKNLVKIIKYVCKYNKNLLHIKKLPNDERRKEFLNIAAEKAIIAAEGITYMKDGNTVYVLFHIDSTTKLSISKKISTESFKRSVHLYELIDDVPVGMQSIPLSSFIDKLKYRDLEDALRGILPTNVKENSITVYRIGKGGQNSITFLPKGSRIVTRKGTYITNVQGDYIGRLENITSEYQITYLDVLSRTLIGNMTAISNIGLKSRLKDILKIIEVHREVENILYYYMLEYIKYSSYMSINYDSSVEESEDDSNEEVVQRKDDRLVYEHTKLEKFKHLYYSYIEYITVVDDVAKSIKIESYVIKKDFSRKHIIDDMINMY